MKSTSKSQASFDRVTYSISCMTAAYRLKLIKHLDRYCKTCGLVGSRCEHPQGVEKLAAIIQKSGMTADEFARRISD